MRWLWLLLARRYARLADRSQGLADEYRKAARWYLRKAGGYE